MDSDMVW